ncbi:TonB-linked SusC/RagA family outer membrane protein [Lacibacter cauensis]|uniref:TonB-linked SusC/RagA family outer membrane protein n=1 Tax=Lacibacter cauensis TaxID=510947 RepID=A0A562SXD6_9BACT|nr:SusC/RagA family TonB-linked outer membrane protein [Lacibacter cauensis]TWI85634.1 TonB-linked SusC/RagA family outer membrane protein [Lacibacter cauensis]
MWNKLTRLLSFTAFFLLVAVSVYAQDVLRGKVTDKDGKPLQGVSVSELDADNRIVRGTQTDIEGFFVLKNVNGKNRISLSYIGYKSVTQRINGRTSINFSLEDSQADLGEVVIVARPSSSNGMINVPEKNLTTAVSRINAKEMEEMQAPSIDQALQGRLSGVDITASSGDPGAAMNIRIRGVSSINSTGIPMIVLDGMPYETEIPSDFNFGTADEQGYAQLLNISPADIKDITVLKDAAATAIWGAKAANGVLVITTKRGSIGKPTINYTFKGSVSVVPKAIPLLNGDQYSSLIPEAFMNRIGTTLNTTVNREFNYDPNDPYWYHNYSNNTNWIDAISRTGYIQDHTVSLTGGGEKAKYFASVGWFDQKGITIGTGLQRINTRINLDYTVSEKIKFFTSFSYTHSNQVRHYLSSNESSIRGMAYIKMPNMSVFEYDANGDLTTNYFSPASNVQGQYSRVYNPVAMADKAKFGVLGDRIIPRFQVDYDIIKRVLKATFDVQFDINNTKNNSFLPQIATGRPNTETVVNRAYDGDIDAFSVGTKTSLIYTPQIKNEKHNVQAYMNILTNDYTAVFQEVMSSNTASSLLVDPSVQSRTQNNELRAVSGQNQSRSVGALIGAQYGYKDKYLINVTLRGDGNSRFGPNYRYGLFPSVSARWRISEEGGLKDLKWLDDLSLRASYGIAGQVPRGDYLFYNTYSTYDYTYLDQAGIIPARMELKNLRWETMRGTNIGYNVSVFKGRIRMDGEVYRNRTKDLFFDGLQIPSFTGFNTVLMNVGTMDNQGWELAVWTQPYKTKTVTVGFDFNISANQNVIREISEFYPSQRGDVTKNGEYLRLLQINNPFGSFYGYKFKGVYADRNATIAKDAKGNPIIGPNGQTIYMRFNYPQTDYIFQPGDAMYEDINNDGNINYMDVVYLGNSNPKLSGGFGPSVTWKNFKLTSFFSFRWGYDVINGTKMNTTNMYGFDNQSTAVLSRWRKEGDVTDMPRALINGGFNWLGSDRYVEDASYIRFRTVTLRYNFDKKTLKKMKMKSASFYVTAENLFTFTNYLGQDPEVSFRGSDPFRVSYDYSMTPPSKNITIGLVASF